MQHINANWDDNFDLGLHKLPFSGEMTKSLANVLYVRVCTYKYYLYVHKLHTRTLARDFKYRTIDFLLNNLFLIINELFAGMQLAVSVTGCKT